MSVHEDTKDQFEQVLLRRFFFSPQLHDRLRRAVKLDEIKLDKPAPIIYIYIIYIYIIHICIIHIYTHTAAITLAGIDL